MRARSHEGKLQVHLAQLKYLLPRLVGQGIMLSRQAGGIGSRGPGESQLELNRRSVRNQIHDIERQLKAVEKIGLPFVKNGWNPVFSKSVSSVIPMLASLRS